VKNKNVLLGENNLWVLSPQNMGITGYFLNIVQKQKAIKQRKNFFLCDLVIICGDRGRNGYQQNVSSVNCLTEKQQW
jgi:hypothetical protein